MKLIDILNYTILNLPIYKFILGFGVFFLFLFARKLFAMSVIKSAKLLVDKTKNKFDDKLLASTTEPIKSIFIVLGLHLSALFLELDISSLTKTFLIFILFWVFYNLTKSFEEDILLFFGKKISKEIGLFIIKALKVFIISLAIVAILQNLGINVSAFIASLGLGGLAFALAAKDTAANLFGGFAILSDNMFKIGDWIRVGDVEGIVEDIGMRTTKIRAFDKRLIILPNATIANSAVDNFSRRDRRRIKMRIGVTYSTTPSEMQKMLEEIRQMLQQHPNIHKEPLFVYFDEFQDSSLSIFFYLFTTTAIWEEYLQIREDINLKIMQIVSKYQTDFAFASNSIYFENELKFKELK
jgi:MscS family membrane protein